MVFYKENKDLVLSSMIKHLKSKRSGQKSSISKLCRELFPDNLFDEDDLLALSDELPAKAKESGVYI